jgi:hypothetical protein
MNGKSGVKRYEGLQSIEGVYYANFAVGGLLFRVFHDLEGCQSRRSTHRATYQVRAGRQPQNRQSAWAHHPGLDFDPRRRSNPVTRFILLLAVDAHALSLSTVTET